MQFVRGIACAVLLILAACVGGTTSADIFTMPWEQRRGPNPTFARQVVAYPTHERPVAAVGLAPVWPVEANLVFVVMPRALDARLKAAGARYYERTNTNLKLHPDEILARLVTSFATKEDEIERFVQLCKI